MSTKLSFDSIAGTKVKDDTFKGFMKKDTLIEYDSPLLIVAESPDGENWLFNWCDSTEEPSAGRWIAFKVTKHRLDALINGHISLREALTLPEEKFYYVFDAKTMFEPIRIKLSSPENLPRDYFPSEDISIGGALLDQNAKLTNKLVLKFHVLSEHIHEGKVPSSIIAPLLAGIQNYFTEVAHIINKASSRSTRVKPKKMPASRAWTAISVASIKTGSFKMECESRTEMPQETEKLSKACELLAKISSANAGDLEALKQSIGKEGLISASALAQCVTNLDLSFSIRWTSPNTPDGYLVIDKRRAQKFLDILESKERELARTRNVTITLTDEEADPIRKDVNGRGGHQSLLRGLKKKLDKDNTIELTPSEIEKILRYGLNYGSGGFQGRLEGIAKALRRVGASIQTT